MGGKMSRGKGQRGERQIIDMLQPVVNEVYEAHQLEAPTLKRNSLQSDGGGSDVAGLPWLALEVKYQEQEHVAKWWEQTLRQAGRDRVPVLVYRRNRSSWRVMQYGILGGHSCGYQVAVVVELEDFLKWFRMQLMQQLES